MATLVKKPESFLYLGSKVYLANDIQEYDPNYFYGCSSGIRKIIDKKKIPLNQYFYASSSKAGWKTCTSVYPKAKLLLKEDWVHENVPKFAITNINYEIDPVPPIMELNINEKFKDSNGNFLDIEVRGERHPKKCYFKVSDVAKAFDMENLQNTIIDKRHDGYLENIHYKYFTINKYDNLLDTPTKPTLKKSLFLTYNGIIRVLFCSRNKNAEKFQDWSTDKLFTIQLGTNDMKDELVAEIKGVNSKAVKSMFEKTGSFPCIYLYKLNTIEEMKKSKIFLLKNDILDNTIICKYGQTENFERRTKEHERDYGKMEGINMELISFSYIDPKYVTEAESSLRSFFNDFNMKVEIEGRSEIVTIPNNLIKQVKQKYEDIGRIYAGRNSEMIIKLAEWKNKYELLQENHKKELESLEIKLEMKEKMYEIELEKKQIEIQLRDERIISMEKIRELEHKLLKSQGIIL